MDRVFFIEPRPNTEYFDLYFQGLLYYRKDWRKGIWRCSKSMRQKRFICNATVTLSAELMQITEETGEHTCDSVPYDYPGSERHRRQHEQHDVHAEDAGIIAQHEQHDVHAEDASMIARLNSTLNILLQIMAEEVGDRKAHSDLRNALARVVYIACKDDNEPEA